MPDNTTFDDLVSPEALLRAWEKFRKNKRKRLDVQIFELRLGDNLFKLHEDLANKTYHHGSYSPFYIRDPKIRLIHKTAVRDRIVHHLLFETLEPVFERSFIFHSYSCRTGKGTHKGVASLAHMARKVYKRHGMCFALKCDIKKFFASIDHNILLQIISKRIKSGDLLRLTRMIVDSFESESGYERERELLASLARITERLPDRQFDQPTLCQYLHERI